MEPRWLTDEQQDTWRALVGLILRLPSALDTQMRRDAGISHFDYLVLSTLSTAPERTMRMSELAAEAEASLPRLSQVVAKLEKQDWVRRAPDPADGRYTLAALTDTGWEKVVATAPGHVDEVQRLVFDVLPKAQQRELKEISRRVTRVIEGD
ncbi:MarR family winged helix-turn-helix transcriptional regulator [Umezawaea tangerina]|uniref:DNA-binding MarR family transcriptional regulator n=1 Tax=Umezawaea tangerina TaxID=84725 RepID=A0A2T0T450_9PSEU|nr:MarR family winged helix-turn-helix transcriptional regulator [Umezawaea tangerina]PRY40458.1 DNA-binding MarR family transcriptional regulator [Umezawaea tangerina]